MAETKRRARGEDSIFYDRSRNRWAGTITVGWETGWTPGPDHRARQDQGRGQGQAAHQAPGTLPRASAPPPGIPSGSA